MDEQEQIEKVFQDLLGSLRKDTPPADMEKIRKAFDFARQAHKGVRRRSGEPYILHPLAVARIATAEIGLGTTSVIAALLHDVVEDTDYTVADIEERFGPKVASIVDGLTKISRVVGTDTTSQAESFRKMILTLSDDVRVILIKLADRLHNMRTLASMPESAQVRIASETLYIYAPLAHRMGFNAIKTELEDLSMRYEHPDEYRNIERKIKAYRDEYTGLYETFMQPIRSKLDENGYAYSISARTKSIYSVWRKMQRKNISFEEIYDLLAVRIVFEPKKGEPEKWQCWNIYSLITDLYSPKPERIRDWVSVPKANGYEALHLTVMGPEGQWFEVQIRSRRMDDVAERGLAAHWKYKHEGEESAELDKWLAGIRELLAQPDANALEFLDEFKLNLFAKEIWVFTPNGEMRTLPKGATALDFAYDIHSEIGNACIGAKVNHRLVPMSYKLSSGDQVEVLTGDRPNPQKEWLDFVVTAKARTHINAAFKKYRKELMRKGIDLYEDLVRKLDQSPTSETLNKILGHFGFTNRDDLYVEIGKGNISREELEKELNRKPENRFVKYWKLQFLWNSKEGGRKNAGKELTNEGSDFVIAPCCNPIPGDDVVGMNIAGTKVIVHKRSCPEAIRMMASFGDRIVPVRWVSQKLRSFLAVVRLTGLDRSGIVSDITALIAAEKKVDMRMVHFETRDGVFEGMLHLYVHNTDDLNRLLAQISQLKGVESVKRVETENK